MKRMTQKAKLAAVFAALTLCSWGTEAALEAGSTGITPDAVPATAGIPPGTKVPKRFRNA